MLASIVHFRKLDLSGVHHPKKKAVRSPCFAPFFGLRPGKIQSVTKVIVVVLAGGRRLVYDLVAVRQHRPDGLHRRSPRFVIVKAKYNFLDIHVVL